ncbi:hypothetical protein B296_00045167 [Ensete ventricosum]|uniref:Uncharacterized protein n=1 Tax=Ensete ventricosum TaxID=4639 RepID=A0A426XZ52_ENSVE|nr:hypothetical protein B296_00045167 [Ensete ventricosum]
MVRITGPYRCTDQLSVRCVSSYTEYTITQYTGVSQCTAHTGPLSDLHTAHTERYTSICKVASACILISAKSAGLPMHAPIAPAVRPIAAF